MRLSTATFLGFLGAFTFLILLQWTESFFSTVHIQANVIVEPLPSASSSPSVTPSSSSSSTRTSSTTSTPTSQPARTRVFRRVAATGTSSLPESFSVAADISEQTSMIVPGTRHRCIGHWSPLFRQGNRTCEFEGLYLDVANSEVWKKYTWAYLSYSSGAPLSVPRNDSVALQKWALSLKIETHVGLAASNREADQWHLEVVVYEELSFEEVSRLKSLPPALFAGATPFQRSFFAQRMVPSNIGHQLLEEYVPMYGALTDLGYEGRVGEFGLLEIDPPEYPGQGFFEATVKYYDGITPRFKPILAGQWLPSQSAAGIPLVAFPVLAAGLMGRSPGGYNADMAQPDHEKNIMWRFRNHYIAGLGLSREDVHDWTAIMPRPAPEKTPFSFMILNKAHKRRIVNVEEIRISIAARYPEARVWIQRWEDLGFDHLQEARLLMNTSIMLSMSGTGINSCFMLPRGSVVINIGAPIKNRLGHIGGQFMYGNSHLKFLHYQTMAPEDADGPGQDANVRLPLDKIMPLVDEAIRVWRNGFNLPVPWPENLSPQGKLVSCLLHRYPEAQWWASFWQGTRTDAANDINENPRAWFQAAADNLNLHSEGHIGVRGYAKAPGYTMPVDFDFTSAHCASWAGAWTIEIFPPDLVRNVSKTMPMWINERRRVVGESGTI